MKTLDKLRNELEHAYNEYDMAKFIDSTERMRREQSYWSKRIADLKIEISEFEDE